ncbi:hypothetical protein P692DRAFT_201340144 [Suillus brevipes Sb2]|nr:hypothetical protein P692DRAFT_201340144 [Suillus brevipes Sb2]
MRGKRLTIPTIACPGEPSCSHSTDDAEPPLIETRQILNYANFEIATALISPTHYCRIITAPVHERISHTSYVRRCGRPAEPHSRKASQVAREQAFADPCTPLSLRPVASMPSADPTFHYDRILDIPVGVSALMPRDRCGWSQTTDLCNDVVSADTLVVHMRKHIGGSSSSYCRIHCSWNGCGKLMRRDCLVRHIREIHLRSKRRAQD